MLCIKKFKLFTYRPVNKSFSALALVGILVLAFLVRIWGINFGFPFHFARPDEEQIVGMALSYFSGDLNPHNFFYPTFYTYSLAFVYAIFGFAGSLFGLLPPLQTWINHALQNPEPFFLIDRVLAALCGAASVYAIFVIAKLRFNNTVAFLSAIILSVAYLHVRDSHFGVTDIPMTLLVLITVWVTLLAENHNTIKWYIFAGIAAGLATATKYNALLVIFPFVVIHLFNLQKDSFKSSFFLSKTLLNGIRVIIGIAGLILIAVNIIITPEFVSTHIVTLNPHHIPSVQAGRFLSGAAGLFCLITSILLGVKPFSVFVDKRVFYYFLFLGLSFFITTPYLVIAFKEFAQYFLSNVLFIYSGHNESRILGWWYYLFVAIPSGVGWICFIAAIAGAIVLTIRNFRLALILFSFPFITFLFFGKGHTAFFRYMLPVIPFVCLGAAYCIWSAGDFISRRFAKAILHTPVIIVLTIICICQSIGNILNFDNSIAKTDNRVIAEKWAKEHIPSGSTILQTGFWTSQIFRSFSMSAKIAYIPLPDYRMILVDDFRKKEPPYPDYIILNQYPLTFQQEKWPVKKAIDRNFDLVKSFPALLPGKKNIFDQQDAFFLPFSGWNGVLRPGPNILIYKRRDPAIKDTQFILDVDKYLTDND